jgi:hypothetical protein
VILEKRITYEIFNYFIVDNRKKFNEILEIFGVDLEK